MVTHWLIRTTNKMDGPGMASNLSQTNMTTIYRTLAQGVFIMSISTVIGSVMALFICLNIVSECKV